MRPNLRGPLNPECATKRPAMKGFFFFLTKKKPSG